jgi:hypothetical protein
MKIREFILKGLNINSPGLSDEGELPRVWEHRNETVRGSILKADEKIISDGKNKYRGRAHG